MDRLTASDADGDKEIEFEIISGNLDPDGDDQFLLGIDKSSGDVFINDLDDLKFLSGQNLALEIQVQDQDLLSSISVVYLSFTEQNLIQKTSDVIGDQWFESSWLGVFYALPNSEWVYHADLGWFHGSFAERDGGWVYSANWGGCG